MKKARLEDKNPCWILWAYMWYGVLDKCQQGSDTWQPTKSNAWRGDKRGFWDMYT